MPTEATSATNEIEVARTEVARLAIAGRSADSGVLAPSNEVLKNEPKMSNSDAGTGKSGGDGNGKDAAGDGMCSGSSDSAAGSMSTDGQMSSAGTTASIMLGASGSCGTDPTHSIVLGALLGTGCFGSVYYGMWHEQKVAVKIIKHPEATNEKVQHEVMLYNTFKNPNVVGSLDSVSFKSAPPQAESLHSRSAAPLGMETWIVLQYCNADTLASALKVKAAVVGTDPSLPSPDIMTQELALVHMRGVLSVARDIAAGMAYLHSLNVCHGDLKPENVLLCYNAGYGPGTSGLPPGSPSSASGGAGTPRPGGVPYVAKVADFGLSKALRDASTHVSTATAGTVTHMCPVLLDSGHLRPACDVYSFGIMLWQMATGSTPYAGMRYPSIVYKVAQGLRPELPAYVPRRLSALAEECWAADHTTRPTFGQLVDRLAKLLEAADELQAEQDTAVAAAREKATAGSH